jgi:hypothetical protein
MKILVALLGLILAHSASAEWRLPAPGDVEMLGPSDYEESGKHVPRYYSLAGNRFTTLDDLKRAISQLPPGSKVLLRGGCIAQDEVALGPPPYMSLPAFRRLCRGYHVTFDWYFGR